MSRSPLISTLSLLICLGLFACESDERQGRVNPNFQTTQINAAQAGAIDLLKTGRRSGVSLDLEIVVNFTQALDPDRVNETHIQVSQNEVPITLNFNLSSDSTQLTIRSVDSLDYYQKYTLEIKPSLANPQTATFAGFEQEFITELDSTFKFPQISDEELLTLVQARTFDYFWDFGHPNSGLARERNTSGDLVTSGGSGFGLMAILVGIERGFISREQGIERLEKIIPFLARADRFHGAWSHWLSGSTGNVIPFSAQDNGGDLVETAFLTQGLLTVRQYLDSTQTRENVLIQQINTLWEEIEWDWYTQEGQNVLYWHWSPEFEWAINLPIRGWNEALIVYVLAASSPSHGVDATVYHQGWASRGAMQNGLSFYNNFLPLGNGRGGPLFFAHYSFLGLDPRNLIDAYADYEEQNTNHTLINRAYCLDNPQNYVGYHAHSWGLTASDNQDGYSAHAPSNDRGVITPTAALASMPYTPEFSMEAMRYFYYILGDRLWGEYGFYDAFNPSEAWFADSYLAIDQGPIVVMIENHRTGLLWDLFMSAPEVQTGLTKLGFTSFNIPQN